MSFFLFFLQILGAITLAFIIFVAFAFAFLRFRLRRVTRDMHKVMEQMQRQQPQAFMDDNVIDVEVNERSK